MGTDLEQFYEVFFEESEELLAEMETCLLGLDTTSPDTEDLNAIFRAAHSIKGGAGTFGFTDMTEMTHMLESLLDKLRKGELTVTVKMIDAFLKAGDVIRGQLAGHRGDGVADPQAAAKVSEELKHFSVTAPALDNFASASSLKPATNNATTTSSNTAVCAQTSTTTTFRINFPCTEILPKVMDNLLANLGEMGLVEKPPLSKEGGAYQLRLTTTASEEDIWEILAFVVNPTELVIAVETQADFASASSINSSEIKNCTASNNKDDNTLAAQTPPVALNQAQPVTTSPQPYGFFPGAPAVPEGVSEEDAIGDKASPLKATNTSSNEPLTATQKTKKSKSTVSESSSIRVGVEKVDQMINLIGELVITQSMLAQTVSLISPAVCEKLLGGLSQLENNTRDLQEAVMSIRMMPISVVFSRFPRVVRDLASKLGKQVELKTVGENTELDKGLIEKIADPLTHLVRNSLDHGIELPDKRLSTGKSASGVITLRAFHQGGNIVIEVSDDGAGMNRDKIIKIAKSRGIAVSDVMPDQDVWMLIFEAGFSTAEVVTDVSGRGVGMDVVKRNICAMGGRVEIDSVFGVGTRITIHLPLTLAVLDGLSVSVGEQMFIVPIVHITESLQAKDSNIKTVNGQGRVLHVRGEYLPVISLHEAFNIRPKITEIEKGILIILESSGRKVAMFVDALLGQHQVVIKSLENNYRRVQGVSGATIMGDGKVALILDVDGLVAAAQ